MKSKRKRKGMVNRESDNEKQMMILAIVRRCIGGFLDDLGGHQVMESCIWPSPPCLGERYHVINPLPHLGEGGDGETGEEKRRRRRRKPLTRNHMPLTLNPKLLHPFVFLLFFSFFFLEEREIDIQIYTERERKREKSSSSSRRRRRRRSKRRKRRRRSVYSMLNAWELIPSFTLLTKPENFSPSHVRHKKAAKLYTIKIKPSTLSPKPETLSSLCLLLLRIILPLLRMKRGRYTYIQREKRERHPRQHIYIYKKEKTEAQEK